MVKFTFISLLFSLTCFYLFLFILVLLMSTRRLTLICQTR